MLFFGEGRKRDERTNGQTHIGGCVVNVTNGRTGECTQYKNGDGRTHGKLFSKVGEQYYISTVCPQLLHDPISQHEEEMCLKLAAKLAPPFGSYEPSQHHCTLDLLRNSILKLKHKIKCILPQQSKLICAW